jgi:hypothetical protein
MVGAMTGNHVTGSATMEKPLAATSSGRSNVCIHDRCARQDSIQPWNNEAAEVLPRARVSLPHRADVRLRLPRRAFCPRDGTMPRWACLSVKRAFFLPPAQARCCPAVESHSRAGLFSNAQTGAMHQRMTAMERAFDLAQSGRFTSGATRDSLHLGRIRSLQPRFVCCERSTEGVSGHGYF